MEETSVNEPEEASKPKRKRRTKAEIEQEELEEEEQYRKWVQTFADLLKGVPKELWFGMFLSWLWARTHGKHIPNQGDLILGLLGGFTLPHAMRGGVLSTGSVWAATYMAALGYNFFDDAWDPGDETPITNWLKARTQFTPTTPVTDAVYDYTLGRFECNQRGGIWISTIWGGYCLLPKQDEKPVEKIEPEA